MLQYAAPGMPTSRRPRRCSEAHRQACPSCSARCRPSALSPPLRQRWPRATRPSSRCGPAPARSSPAAPSKNAKFPSRRLPELLQHTLACRGLRKRTRSGGGGRTRRCGCSCPRVSCSLPSCGAGSRDVLRVGVLQMQLFGPDALQTGLLHLCQSSSENVALTAAGSIPSG